MGRICFSYFVLRKGKQYSVYSLTMLFCPQNYHEVGRRGESFPGTFTDKLQTLLLVLNICVGMTRAPHVDLAYVELVFTRQPCSGGVTVGSTS